MKMFFWPLPSVPILLFWNAMEEEQFGVRCHLLFDAHVTDYLDLESLLFLTEQLQDRLLASK